MVFKFLMPIYIGDCVLGFESDRKYSSSEYINLIEEKFNEDKDYILDIWQTQLGSGLDKNILKKVKVKYKQVDAVYIGAECKIKNKEGNDVTLGELINLHNTEKEGAFEVILIKDINSPIGKKELDADLEIELNKWSGESYNIASSKELSIEEKLKHLPLKDFKIEIISKNDKDEEVKYSCIFEGCRLVEKGGVLNYRMIVNRVSFVK